MSTFLTKPGSGAVILIEQIGNLEGLTPDKFHFLQQLLDTIPDMIYFKDTKNKFVLVNTAHAKALNLPTEKIIGKTDLDLFPKELAKKYFADDNKILKTGKPIVCKITKSVRPDGGITYISTTKIPHYDKSGKIIGTIGITRNITDHLIAEEELRTHKDTLEKMVKKRTKELEKSKEELESISNSKSEFASVVSHELRTPLSAIQLGIDSICKDVTGNLSDKQKEYLCLITNSLNRLTRLTDDVLDLQKIQSGKIILDTKEEDINKLADEVYQIMKKFAEEKNLKLKLNLGKNIPLIQFNKNMLLQVLSNLVNNAIKFTEKGTIEIITRKKSSNKIELSVKDTGRGIKKEDLDSVFESFKQLDYTKAPEKGSGLGLTISKNIIEQSGGKIIVNSEYGKGTSFSIFLSIKPPKKRKTKK